MFESSMFESSMWADGETSVSKVHSMASLDVLVDDDSDAAIERANPERLEEDFTLSLDLGPRPDPWGLERAERVKIQGASSMNHRNLLSSRDNTKYPPEDGRNAGTSPRSEVGESPSSPALRSSSLGDFRHRYTLVHGTKL